MIHEREMSFQRRMPLALEGGKKTRSLYNLLSGDCLLFLWHTHYFTPLQKAQVKAARNDVVEAPGPRNDGASVL